MHKRLAWFCWVATALSAVGCSSSGNGSSDAGGGGGSDSGSTAGADTAGGAPTTSGTTALEGTLGELGAVKPIVSSLVILNSGERLVYMSTAPITCDTLSTSRWLGSTPADSQVVEIVVKASVTTGTIPVGKAEVNYAKGGRSSSYEVNASSGSVTFTINDPMGVAEGSVDATYDSPAGSVKGTFHAEFCDGGQGY
jgi:hypothetical protein